MEASQWFEEAYARNCTRQAFFWGGLSGPFELLLLASLLRILMQPEQGVPQERRCPFLLFVPL